ncbi:fibrinogen-related protein 3-2 [Plakobranchus ocellatus]|uniref:Fibrinogen-related protein 3-2 n=1 Tax=Plakobranchus ocellatus TaxID=259542 RepID=A0AAV4D2R0_9GAST|nr:fibrinogen-related protein 3-2 [Plakobranchus ocellatus]
MGNDVTKTYPPYVIMSHDGPKRQILCDTHTDGGGWITFQIGPIISTQSNFLQRRVKGDVDFYLDWTSYREGFGSLTGDIWMGNEALYNLTIKCRRRKHSFSVVLEYPQEACARISPRGLCSNIPKRYRLQFGSYSGTGGDGMTYHGGASVSTFDRDNDQRSGSCAVSSRGAWWYKSCYRADLNREWVVTETNTHGWYDGRTHWPVSFSEMKMRRIHVI